MKRIGLILVVLICATAIADPVTDDAAQDSLVSKLRDLTVEQARQVKSLGQEHPDVLRTREKIKAVELQIRALNEARVKEFYTGRDPSRNPFTHPRDYSRDPGTGMPIGWDSIGQLDDKVAWLYSELTKVQAATSTVTVAELKREMDTIVERLDRVEKLLLQQEKKPESNKASEATRK
jgi:hypothetical protein